MRIQSMLGIGTSCVLAAGTLVGVNAAASAEPIPAGQAAQSQAVDRGNAAQQKVLKPTGGVVGWGRGIKNGTSDIAIELSSGVSAIAAGGGWAIAAVKDGGVQLSEGSTKVVGGVFEFRPIQVPDGFRSGITAVDADWDTLVALKGDRVIAWQMPGGSEQHAYRAEVPVEATSGISAVSVESGNFLALKGGGVIAWGSDNGYPEPKNVLYPVPPEVTSGITAISAGGYISMALKGDRVIAWTSDYSGFQLIPVPLEMQSGVSAIAAGHAHMLALKNGRVLGAAWGSDPDGAGTPPAEALSGVTQIAAGSFHSLALKDGRVIAWGSDYDGPNFRGDTNVPDLAKSRVIAIAAGQGQSLALVQDDAGSSIGKPRAVRGLKAVQMKRGFRVVWKKPARAPKPAANGLPRLVYEVSIDGEWNFRRQVVAERLTGQVRPGRTLTIGVRAVTAAGPGPTRTVVIRP